MVFIGDVEMFISAFRAVLCVKYDVENMLIYVDTSTVTQNNVHNLMN